MQSPADPAAVWGYSFVVFAFGACMISTAGVIYS